MGLRRWNSSEHPRDARGRFVSKLSVGLRVNTRSASVTVGRRFPVIPGKVNVYTGALIRVERANRGNGIVDRKIDAAQAAIVSRLPSEALRGFAQGIAENGRFKQGSTLVTVGGIRPQTPTIRLTNNGAKAKDKNTITRNKPRSPNRKPRAPRQPRARRVA